MTLDRCSVLAKVKRPPDWGTNTCAATAVGVPAQGPNGQIRGALVDPRPRGRRGWRPTPARIAANTGRPGIRPHSTPIARAAGGAV